METTMSLEKHIRKNGEWECWWSRIASPYPDANSVAPPAPNDEEEYRTRSLFFLILLLLFTISSWAPFC